ncbi:hypothetical protein [Bradyrhizobium sp. NP1]|uniref:hypothetical protein n=1 Tax=Bradyrhizobium sp. NP1 TaxID=3049772 RepID=UPI0025A51BFF|nr:hypothetical protein [Bradyrhizobium sp. NP1]WJR78498.1 hypothetical protein QOU61_01405 [Bradyrhizobium sp. NP1]
MLTLDNLPNTVPSKHHDNDLGGAPNAADGSIRSDRCPGERSAYFVTWPAHEGTRFVPVRVGTEELARISGETFVINSEKITAALVKHRALIEQRANERLAAQPGASEITLDIGSLG